MERNTETKTLSFSKGMTNIPSDAICEDGELLESDGFIYKDGSMVPIQKPVDITGGVPLEGKLVYVHKLADYRNLITYIEDKERLVCYVNFKNGETEKREENKQTIDLDAKLLDVKSVGNTLVCATDKGLHYILCKGHSYSDLGTELPKPKVEFYTDGTTKNWQNEQDELKKDSFMCNLSSFVSTEKGYAHYYPLDTDDVDKSYSLCSTGYLEGDAEHLITENYNVHKINQDKETDFKNAVIGHVSQMINWVKDKNKFAFPFFVRFALKMFDGSYARISNPIICYPSINKNVKFVQMGKKDKGYYTEVDSERGGSGMYMYLIGYSGLFFKATIDNKDNWSDIIKELVVFATDDVMPFELNEDWKFKDPMDIDNTIYFNGGGSYHENIVDFRHYLSHKDQHDYPLASEWLMPVYKTNEKIIKELLEKTQFYKLFSLDLDSKYIDGEWHDSSERSEGVSDINIMDNGVVSTLTEQEQLKVDDYYGWTKLVPSKLFTYNNRLNTVGTARYPFEGFNFFADCKEGVKIEYEYYTHIVNQQIDTWVKSDTSDNVDPMIFTGWLFYPDPYAKEMIIMVKGEKKGWHVNLHTHKMLNGAYSFANLPVPGNGIKISDMDIPTVSGDFEDLNSQIFTSVVNNPFVFEASGDNTVGTGKILGIVANTEAVSQGQFGQYPLLVFTSEGIYGMSVNSEGLYSATYPISREVCLENSPLVPTDRLIFFASKKGLMAAIGGSVACVSEQLRGRQADPMQYYRLEEGPISLNRVADLSIAKFLVDSFVAYDYRDSLLRIFAKDKSYQYIYNMVDHTFAVDNSGIMAQSVVNDYPDNLIQDTAGNVYSLTDKPDINEDENLYSGIIITRPMKLGSSMILKSLREIRNIRKTTQGKLTLKVLANNNAGQNWCQLTSLLGKPWAFFTFEYTLTDFKASDSFQGSVVVVQNRRSLLRGQN